MPKTAFVFPGQGSQFVGMGKEIVENYSVAQRIFEEADEVLGYKISEICFQGPEESLKKTVYTQPALLTTSYALYKVMEEKGYKPDAVAGHSLGEYTALVVAGALQFQDAVQLVSKRGQYMEEAVPNGKGTMAAILGMEFDDVKSLCEDVADIGVVELANINCPGQVVIAGETEAVKRVVQIAPERGAKKAVLLNVSGPFHSSLMIPAAEKLANELQEIQFNNPKIPVVINYSGEFVDSAEVLREGLKKQVNNSVLWDKSIRTLIKADFKSFIEIGPGKVLSGLIKKIDKKLNIANFSDLKSLEKIVKKMEEQQ